METICIFLPLGFVSYLKYYKYIRKTKFVDYLINVNKLENDIILENRNNRKLTQNESQFPHKSASY